MNKKIAILAGDGIGPEIMAEARKILNKVAEKFGHHFEYQEALIGGAAWEKFGEHFPNETKRTAAACDAILFGSVGGPVHEQMNPKWKDCERNSILSIRKFFDFNVNLRPVKVYKSLMDFCVLKKEIVEKGIDILCVRELSEDVYFGGHKIEGESGHRRAYDEMFYNEKTIAKVARAAFEAARGRKKKVSSVDKVNVLDCSRLWREVVETVAKDFPDCKFEHVLVDNCAMQILKRPSDFDVILLPNMFGDIISDEASVLAGSLGMLPSASLNGGGFGLYEASGGSAQDIAGKGIANPIAEILSAAMMLKYSFQMDEEHDVIVAAVEKALDDGYRTADIAATGELKISCSEMGDIISNNIL